MIRSARWLLPEIVMTQNSLEPPASAARRPPRVLVADDSAEQRWTLRLALSMMGFDVTEAADGRELFWALEHSDRKPEKEPELVIADVYMPAYNGLDVLGAWSDSMPRHPLIVITAFPDKMLKKKVHELGALLLAKPFTLAALSRTVRQALRKARSAPC
jgi:DNA-binding response OmpR family regulator